MGWIRYENLNRRNCLIANVKFVKSTAKRRKLANLYDVDNFWIEAELHVTEYKKYLRCSWANSLHEKWYKTYQCWSALHISVFVKDDQLYSKSGNDLRKFNNTWLFNKIMKLTFRGKNDKNS